MCFKLKDRAPLSGLSDNDLTGAGVSGHLRLSWGYKAGSLRALDDLSARHHG